MRAIHATVLRVAARHDYRRNLEILEMDSADLRNIDWRTLIGLPRAEKRPASVSPPVANDDLIGVGEQLAHRRAGGFRPL